MPAFVESEKLKNAWVPPPASPLDEAVWQAWVAKGRAQDQRSSAVQTKAVKWASVAGLLAAAGLWSHLGPFEVALRFLVITGATVVMFQAFQARRYAITAVFGALALLYNPVVPAFGFSGAWQRAVVAVSAVLFVTALVWPTGRIARTEHND